MVIVCEDSVVTPTYLGKIRQEVIQKGEWSNIEIFPVPPPDVTTVKNNIPDKSRRKIKNFVGEQSGLSFEIEDQYKAVPVRYVREVQLRMQEGGYDEGWAAYDLNGHTRHAEAYDLSQNEPFVKLAFTSISIEHWFLLHFVRDKTSYQKSHDVPIQTFIPKYAKTADISTTIYGLTIPHIEIALENAAWLRTINSKHPKPCYLINPYIDMDLLVKRLYGISETIYWGFLNEPVLITQIEFLITRIGGELRINVINKSSISVVSQQTTFYALDRARIKQSFNVAYPLLRSGESVEFTLTLPSPSLFNICFDGQRALIEV